MDAGGLLSYPAGNVIINVTLPGNAIFTTAPSAANIPGVSVSNVSSTATTASFTVNGVAGATTISFSGLEIGLTSCAGTIGSLTAAAQDDNGAGIVGGTATFGGVVPGDQLINGCVSALDLSVISDEANNDTLVLQSDGTLSPDGYLGALAYTCL